MHRVEIKFWKVILVFVAVLAAAACGGTPRYRYFFSTKGGAQRGLPIPPPSDGGVR